MAKVPPLIVICGTTASGKSQLALDLAQRLNAVILGADSRQIYKELDIGTAKPTLGDRQTVPHYLIDICEPTENFTLAEYQRQAQELIASLNQPILLVGGTGLYIQAIVKGLKIPAVPPQTNLREQLANLGQPFCYQLLSQVDPVAQSKIEPADVVRTLRALEVFYATGRPISSLQGENPPSYPIVQIGLGLEPEQLQPRIVHRTHAMVEAGLVKEVEGLINQYGEDLPLLHTLGYAEIKQYLQGQISLTQATESIIVHTRQFAKRQRTWFRKDSAIHWFDANQPNLLDSVTKLVQVDVNEGMF
ncbi:tRNA delta-2-isopentenylpyrophosphate (IPP) transferase [Synechocystis sp. PCC 6803]|uniref:tRNA dimethylallyltransferase n=1 Tax=Synechocystis sp. (strain ATCC 27184 / PCC 6803 / Kazusa) TaxID=1111708 RepID=MIAA_SYNY3|nr:MULTISPECIES: tRNA (adenosine(37)-N6)-dimethylallyltransferase MiaA [unclassified Synechocystis]P74040.1 RecName: Full=tRNA dimethylallyltransferase; AltName: Full=Dimethylallyl diphosphate:tRNA dimethylallyltransferase; Short=DMAPP:tRNA dimethylallyltransferase; Short=DMATase; AltName: Full=Isopentenyl-diphosphate:tRNA isopentenyltransferase; Short=IPP transferase; Short=IPPT; Short=IPTase [Synechocystis sp. PCC 6803 substr. Kazusa]BAM51866.1 tRNA delta(2)-isopentenylpyrophosphatetransferase 